MALQSVSPGAQLLHSTAKPSSVLVPNRGGAGGAGNIFSVDFVGLCCKSKRTRRRLGDPGSRSLSRLHSAGKSAWPSSVKAVLDLKRNSRSVGESPRQSGDKLQWCSEG